MGLTVLNISWPYQNWPCLYPNQGIRVTFYNMELHYKHGLNIQYKMGYCIVACYFQMVYLVCFKFRVWLSGRGGFL